MYRPQCWWKFGYLVMAGVFSAIIQMPAQAAAVQPLHCADARRENLAQPQLQYALQQCFVEATESILFILVVFTQSTENLGTEKLGCLYT